MRSTIVGSFTSLQYKRARSHMLGQRVGNEHWVSLQRARPRTSRVTVRRKVQFPRQLSSHWVPCVQPLHSSLSTPLYTHMCVQPLHSVLHQNCQTNASLTSTCSFPEVHMTAACRQKCERRVIPSARDMDHTRPLHPMHTPSRATFRCWHTIKVIKCEKVRVLAG